MSNDKRRVGRRKYIKYVGSAAAIGASGLAGCTGGNGGGDGGSGSGSGGSDSGSDSGSGGSDSGSDSGSGGSDSGSDSGSSGGQPVSLTMASFKEGTGWYVMGGALSDAVSPALPQGSQISVRPFGGSIGCIKLLDQGKADLGLNHPVTAQWATEGKYVFDKKYDGLRAILGHMDTYWVLIAARKKFGYSSFAELKKDKPKLKLGTGPEGGVANTGVKQAFEASGITYDDVKNWGGKVVRLGFGDMPSAMRNGDIDMMGWVATPGHPTWTQIANDVDLSFFSIEGDARQKMLDEGWMDMPPMPKGEFGAAQKVPSVGWRTMLLTDTRMADSTAYTFAKAIVEKKDSIASAYDAFKVFDPKKAGEKKFTAVPLHPGAKKYLQEQGYL
ncbi:MAG: TAXI family TRAP transporter solute-binding subunit [Salinigranum sp.]